MQTPLQTEWKVPATWFALFNVLLVPILGRTIWFIMLRFNTGDLRLASVLFSVVGAVGILAANSMLTIWARRTGMPRAGLVVMWLITGVTFLLTIGFGTFSPINLLIGLIRFGSGT